MTDQATRERGAAPHGEHESAVSLVSPPPDHPAHQRQPLAAPAVQLGGQRRPGPAVRGQRPVPTGAPEPRTQEQSDLTVSRETHARGRKNCPCFRCRRAKALSTATWKAKITSGEPIWGDIDAVRAHVAKLSRMGMGARVVSRVAGVAEICVRSDRTERITHAVAQRILATQFDVRAVPPGAIVDSTGARRRLQALIVAGWNVPTLAAEAGIPRQQLRRYLFEPRYSAKVCVRLIDLFERLWLTRPPTLGPLAAARVQDAIERHGWVGLGAWEDGTIDDPDAAPVLDDESESVDDVLIARVLAGAVKFSRLGHLERVELARQWDALGHKKSAFSKRFGVNTEYTQRYFDLAGATSEPDDQKDIA